MKGFYSTKINKQKFSGIPAQFTRHVQNFLGSSRTMSTDMTKLRRNVATIIDRLSSPDFCSRGDQGGIDCLKIFGTGRNDTSLGLFTVTGIIGVHHYLTKLSEFGIIISSLITTI
jgi:hypothetical protein